MHDRSGEYRSNHRGNQGCRRKDRDAEVAYSFGWHLHLFQRHRRKLRRRDRRGKTIDDQPRIAQRSISEIFAPLPCKRMPTRNTRPAAKTQSSVETRTIATPTSGCHIGIPGGTAWRITISIGVAGGKSDIVSAIVEFGSRTMLSHTNIGDTSSSMTGVIMLCASFMSVTAAPI